MGLHSMPSVLFIFGMQLSHPERKSSAEESLGGLSVESWLHRLP